MTPLKFSKVSKRVFARRLIDVYVYDEDGQTVVDLTYDPEENDCSSGRYVVEEHTTVGHYRFRIIPAKWNDPQLPQVIEGELAFRRMVNTVDIRPQ